jgi:hypothetical protein
LPICDFWAELDSKIEEGRKLKEMTEGIGKGKPGNVFTGAEWEAARRKHAEKMKAKK